MSTELNQILKELHLPEFVKNHEEIARTAIANQYSYEQYLQELAILEYEERSAKRIERMIRESNLPPGKTINGFDRDRLPFKVRAQLNSLLEGGFTGRTENVLIFGNPGSGKSHLLCAIGYRLISQNKRVLFSTCNLLVQELLVAKKELRLPQVLKRIARFDALIIDDIGYIQQSREEMEVLFTLLADCYERTSVMLTSNLVFSDWEKIFKDPMTTAAAIDRLVHHSIILELNIPSYRLESAKKKKHEEKKGGKNGLG
jgi:DNA replication protein DnaC